MSGIEVVGLVLAAVPLVIAALEHYEDIVGPLKVLHKFHGELGRAIQELGNQHVLFEQAIEVLLRPITMDQELSDMMDNTNSKLWQDSEIEEQLRNHLGRAYVPYTKTVNDIQNIMVGIVAKLDNLHGAENVTKDGLEAIVKRHAAAKVDGKLQKFEISKRVKFTMKRKRIKESLAELQRCIENLDKFQIKADKISAGDELYKSDSRSKISLPVETIRENAKKLHNVLSKTWCTSHASHSVGLLLEQRLIKRSRRGVPGWQNKRSREVRSDLNCFGLSFPQSPVAKPRKWLDAEIRLVESDDESKTQGPTVRIKISEPRQATTAAFDPLLGHNLSSLQIVTDLCFTLQNESRTCLDFCLDNDGHLRGTHDTKRTVAYINDEVSLENILQKRSYNLSQKERYTLSITLASSLLQLSQTPWLQGPWNKADIIFLRAKDRRPVSEFAVDLAHPYLAREHKHTSPSIQTNGNVSNDSLKVVNLGIMLLEICYSLPIEELLEPDDVGPNGQHTSISYLQAARRCLMRNEDRGEFSFAFSKAISYCLQCFLNPNVDLSNIDFLKSIEAKVLVPLEDEMGILLFGPLYR
ncbi:hypothetical protein CC80DRAFT_582911 [Byssothecium circinans]|uniref:DUF7580 domain-containing protein n=1 Tax=Byssothecium circinans TaxID=147558 RepID=A0A6A5UGY3_9PLEO|nr:hypothetical protein CC80DRAFT_582911 [Byssothecium circinans]